MIVYCDVTVTVDCGAQTPGEPAEPADTWLTLPAAGNPESALSPELGTPLPVASVKGNGGVALPAAGEPGCCEGR